MDEPTETDSPPPRARRSDRRRRGGRAVTSTSGSTGRRSQARQRRRRRTVTRTGVVLTLLALVALVVLAVVSGLADRARELVTSDQEPEASEVAGDRQPTLALVTYVDGEEDAGARSIAVLAHDREDQRGTILLVPPSTVADVPGHGSFGVGQAFAFGGADLTGVTLENLLGIRLDEVVAMSETQWASLLESVGGYEIEVARELRAADGENVGSLRFEAGPQTLDGPRLAEYLTLEAEGQTELDALPRVQRVLGGLFDRLAERPELLETVIDEAPVADATDPDIAVQLLGELAEARAADRLVALSLPVSPLGSGRDDVYRVDDDRLEQLIDDRFALSRPTDEAGAGRNLQILNGNGVPGIGQVVAERLQPGGYRVLLTGNADRFDYETTRIVVYDDTPEQLAAARDIRERLGVGEIERSGTPQSVVDVTIVVGADLVGDDVPDGVAPLDPDDAGAEAEDGQPGDDEAGDDEEAGDDDEAGGAGGADET